jgi:hypothetical protein
MRYCFAKLPLQNPGFAWIWFDEVQGVTALLGPTQKLIQEKHFRFDWTGSSRRKLRRGQANSLVGHAFVDTLFPLMRSE